LEALAAVVAVVLGDDEVLGFDPPPQPAAGSARAAASAGATTSANCEHGPRRENTHGLFPAQIPNWEL
jgi:hypothetical protein